MRYLGIDYGTKRVGTALSDEAGTMGFPHKVLNNTSRLAEELLALIEREKVEALVIGESRDFSGKENAVAHEAKKLGAELAEAAGIPLHFESEIFTTQEARRFPTGERFGSKEPIDAAAAALILTSFLSRS